MKVLLTGATGFLGKAVLGRLLADRHEVVALVRQPSAALPGPVVQVACDLGRLAASSLEHAGRDDDLDLGGMDAVVHCAARAHVMKDAAADPLAEYRRVNVAGTLALARRAAQVGARRFVFISSIGVNGKRTIKPFTEADQPAPHDDYSLSKWEAEQGLTALGHDTLMETVIIRPPLIYGAGAPGNFGRLLHWVAAGVPLPLGAVRENRRSLVALDNLVDLIATCLHHPAAANQVFLAGDGEDLSTADLLRRLAQAMGRPARLVPVPVWMLRAGAAALGKRAVAERLLGSLQVDGSKARERLAWAPPVSVDEGLRRAAGRLLGEPS